MADDTPFDDIGPWCNVDIAGKRLGVYLTAIDGVSTKWEWQEQKASGTSGAKQVYKGAKKGHPKLTFTATEKADFQELGDIWNQIVPKPGQATGGAPAPAKTPGQTFAMGSPSASTGSAGGTPQPTSNGGYTIPDPTAAKTDAKDSGKDAGPRPPTLPISNRILEWHAITAFAAEEWAGPTPGETGEWTVVLTIIPQDEPKPAGSGAMTPVKPGSQFSGGSPVQNGQGGSGSGSGGSKMDGNAAAGAAGV
jgi:hypothetical protein